MTAGPQSIFHSSPDLPLWINRWTFFVRVSSTWKQVSYTASLDDVSFAQARELAVGSGRRSFFRSCCLNVGDNCFRDNLMASQTNHAVCVCLCRRRCLTVHSSGMAHISVSVFLTNWDSLLTILPTLNVKEPRDKQFSRESVKNFLGMLQTMFVH